VLDERGPADAVGLDFGELSVLFGELRAERVSEARIRKALEWVWKNLLEHKIAALLITTATLVIRFGRPIWESLGDTMEASHWSPHGDCGAATRGGSPRQPLNSS
jgi:hypothetical protein